MAARSRIERDEGESFQCISSLKVPGFHEIPCELSESVDRLHRNSVYIIWKIENKKTGFQHLLSSVIPTATITNF